eukprot:gene40672-50324_t
MALATNDSDAVNLIEVVKSPSSPDQYGIVSKEDIPYGTHLGFFKGKLVMGSGTIEELLDFNGPFHKSYGLADPNGESLPSDIRYIDGSAFDSSFARYYVTSPVASEQNVTVERLADWTDHNEAISFMANTDIKKDEELRIAPFQDYGEQQKSKRYQCGIVAKADIPYGTHLGFFRGRLFQPGTSSDLRYVDGSAFDSSFARYYLTSPVVAEQNVTVERLADWADHNEAICFLAN